MTSPLRLLLLFLLIAVGSAADITLARLRYEGGGDWYNDPDALPNLARELNTRTNIRCQEAEAVTSLTDANLFEYPFLFVTGHGNVTFSDEERARLRRYVQGGGFVYVDDDYGMDESMRLELTRVFPDNALVELPFDHPIYHVIYDFPQGLPKIHEHYPGPPRGFGVFLQDRLVLFYTYNTNISDGWSEAHDDPPEKRDASFRFGVNVVAYALSR